MRQFTLGQRVLVSVRDLDGAPLGVLAHGTVTRLRHADALAWVCLDKRINSLPTPHPFPADDATRSAHVLADPGDCTAVTT